MNTIQIIGGVILVILCVIIIAVVTAQEGKGGLGALAGGDSPTFFDKNRGKTKEAMLVRITSMSGIAFGIIALGISILLK